MKAQLLVRSKDVLSDGAIVETVIWQLPEPTAGSGHAYKYRLYYGKAGARIVGFDNERGKGDHIHRSGKEVAYNFVGVDELIVDFLREVRRARRLK